MRSIKSEVGCREILLLLFYSQQGYYYVSVFRLMDEHVITFFMAQLHEFLIFSSHAHTNYRITSLFYEYHDKLIVVLMCEFFPYI